jgi:Ca2+-binding RTX toxin-like protein
MQINGTSRNDTLTGTTSNDVIYGDLGNDNITGSGTINILFGGSGNDKLTEGANAQFAVLYGEDGNDTLIGGTGRETLDGGTGDDYINAGLGLTTLYGGAGNDTLVGATGAIMVGGTGNDNFIADFTSSLQTITITDFEGAGVAGGDTLTIKSGYSAFTSFESLQQSILYSDGKAYIPVLAISPFNLIKASLAISTVVIEGITTPLIASDFNFTTDISAPPVTGSAITGAQSAGLSILNGTEGNDTIAANGAIDILYGDAGNDLIVGSRASAFACLYGETGNDTLIGGIGRETLDGGDGNDSITGGGTINILLGGAGDDRLTASASTQFAVLYGEDGNDTITGGYGSSYYSRQTLDGGAGNDYITGGYGYNTILGGAGNDTILAGTSDSLTGGTGTDSFVSRGRWADIHISDFEGAGVAGGDTIIFVNGPFASTNDIMSHITYSNGNATIERIFSTGSSLSNLTHGINISIVIENISTPLIASDFRIIDSLDSI